MSGEHVPPASEPREPDPKWRAMRPAVSAHCPDLERLRDVIRQRLDQIEVLAREGIANPAEELLALQRRIADLEEANEQLRVEAERRERDWQAGLERLEQDRELLADAWDRLERERIEEHIANAVPHAHRAGSASSLAPADRPSAPQVRSELSGMPDDPVAQAILRQFEILRGDVRRNASRRSANS